MNRAPVLALLLCLSLMISGAPVALAGPPFFTDDPEPVDYEHGEFYVASVTSHNSDGTSGTLPHFEFNYGPLPDLQLHVIVPFAYSKPRDESMKWGYGVTELGIKYRLIHETDTIPQAGIFPLMEIPTADSTRGLGERGTKVFLPIWIQKSFGPWTIYGGAGFWNNPGEEANRNFWQTGIVAMRELSKTIAVGGEIYNFTGRVRGDKNEMGFNLGTVINITEDHHILFSAGRDFTGTNKNTLNVYAAYQLTFGPHKETKEKPFPHNPQP